MSGPTIRRVAEKDAAAIWQLVENCPELDSNSFYCYFVLCRYLAPSCVIAEEDGRAVGFATALISPDRPDTCFVWQLYVAPDQRGRRLAAEMLIRLIGDLRPRPFFVEATVGPDNQRSRRTFHTLARHYGAPISETPCLGVTDFPVAGGAHEPENLIRIGPLDL